MLIGKGCVGDIIEHEGNFRVLVRHASVPGTEAFLGPESQQWWVAECDAAGKMAEGPETATILGKIVAGGTVAFDSDAEWRLKVRDGVGTEN